MTEPELHSQEEPQQQQQQQQAEIEQDTNVEGATAGQTLSKRQLKKQRKRELYLEKRVEKRRLEKERRKAKRRLKSQDQQQDVVEASTPQKQLTCLMKNSTNKFRVVIDMDFEQFMTDDEISKAVKQLGRVYAANRRSPRPFQLYVSSLTGKIRDKFVQSHPGHNSWDVNKCEQDYETLFRDEDGATTKFIYLSGDAESNLEDVDKLCGDESMIFVIGGLVDHNRHKNLCYTRAKEKGIQCAKLPIREHVTLSQRHILSTVTVFEILLYALGSLKPWPEAFIKCIPQRKLATETTNDKQKPSQDQAT